MTVGSVNRRLGGLVTLPSMETIQERAYARRWIVLGVLCCTLVIIAVDITVLTIGIPSIARSLHASSSELQWIFDAYTLVFAVLLLTGGSLGDRFGRRGMLQVGLAVFGIGSLVAAFAGSAGELIAGRAILGVGAACILPATLSIVRNLFPAHERGTALGIWAATAGFGSALGPVIGGVLLDQFWWGSVFLINLPVVLVAMLAGVFLVPTSRDPTRARLDPPGVALSIIGLLSVVYGIIEAPRRGWTDAVTLLTVVGGFVVLVVFLVYERHRSQPMLDIQLFRNPRFSAATTVFSLQFFANTGAMFVLTQYEQFVLGYSPLATGLQFAPWSVMFMGCALVSARIARRFGTKTVVVFGMSIAASGALLLSFLDTSSQFFPDVFFRGSLITIGMGTMQGPTVESVIGALSRAKAGAGSAVNDTIRQVGGALGLAVIGSVVASVYGSRVGRFLEEAGASDALRQQAERSLGTALQAASRRSGDAVVGLARAARDAFVDGMHAGMRFSAGALFLGALVALVWLPARAGPAPVDETLGELAEAEALFPPV